MVIDWLIDWWIDWLIDCRWVYLAYHTGDTKGRSSDLLSLGRGRVIRSPVSLYVLLVEDFFLAAPRSYRHTETEFCSLFPSMVTSLYHEWNILKWNVNNRETIYRQSLGSDKGKSMSVIGYFGGDWTHQRPGPTTINWRYSWI